MGSVIGVVLAGGAGRRIGGDKALVQVDGQPLLNHPLEALRAVCPQLAVVCKRDTMLPALGADVAIWHEPDEPRHPLTGLLHALRCAAPADVLVCAVDLAALDAASLGVVLDAAAAAPEAAAVVPRAEGRLQPLCALYRQAATADIEGFDPSARVLDVVGAMTVHEVPFASGAPFANVNTAADADQLLRAWGFSRVFHATTFCRYSAGQR